MLKIALSLIAQGFHTDAVFFQLRSMYNQTGPDCVPDSEIENVVKGALSYKPLPHAKRNTLKTRPSYPPQSHEGPIDLIKRFIGESKAYALPQTLPKSHSCFSVLTDGTVQGNTLFSIGGSQASCSPSTGMIDPVAHGR
jgi:hypothetical protein